MSKDPPFAMQMMQRMSAGQPTYMAQIMQRDVQVLARCLTLAAAEVVLYSKW